MAKGPQGATGNSHTAPGANGPAGPNLSIGQIVNFSPKRLVQPIASGGPNFGVLAGGATSAPGPIGYVNPFSGAWDDPESSFIQMLKQLAATKDISEIHELVDKSYNEYLVESVIDS